MKLRDGYIKKMDEITAITGGPAFPTEVRGLGEAGIPTIVYHGMTLRDWFAGQALTGLYERSLSDSHMAHRAYRMADAMLAERSKKQEG